MSDPQTAAERPDTATKKHEAATPAPPARGPMARRWLWWLVALGALATLGLGWAVGHRGRSWPERLGRVDPVATFELEWSKRGVGGYDGALRIYPSGGVVVETEKNSCVLAMRGEARLGAEMVGRLVAALPNLAPTRAGKTGLELRACLRVGATCYGLSQPKGALEEVAEVFRAATRALESSGTDLRSPLPNPDCAE